MKPKDIAIPENWSPLVRRAMLYVFSSARHIILANWSESENSQNWDLRNAGYFDRFNTGNSQTNDQLRIIHARMSRINPSKRPHYNRFERMKILEIKAARGWNNKQTAEEFLIDEETVASWIKQIDEKGELVKIPAPVNKYPEAVEYVVQRLKALYPCFGKKFIAEILFRSGLHLSSTTVGRILKRQIIIPPEFPEPESTEEIKVKKITSRHPDHTWLIDLTAVPTLGGFWVPWFPNCVAQHWPFSWCISVIIDHFSRKVIGFAVFKKQPEATEIINMLEKAIKRVKRTPKYIISDKGQQFWSNNAKKENQKNHPYIKWCEKKNIKTRHGAVGKYGSVAIIERFIKSLKTEGLYRLDIPLNIVNMREELFIYIVWYNEYRPHQTLKARTPREVYQNSPPLPVIDIKPNSKLPEFKLKIRHLEGRKHLPIIELEMAA